MFNNKSEMMTDSFPERSTMVLTHLPSLSQSVEASWSDDCNDMIWYYVTIYVSIYLDYFRCLYLYWVVYGDDYNIHKAM